MPRFPISSAAIAAILIVALTEGAFMRWTEPLTGMPVFEPTVDDATLVAKRRLLPRVPGAILLIGDSSCTMGLDPAAFESAGLGRPVNLGSLASFTMVGFSALGEEALDARPRAVVIAILPRSFEMTEGQTRDFNLLGRYLTAYDRRSPVYELRPYDRWSWFAKKHRFNLYPQEFGGSFAVYSGRLESENGHYRERGTYTGPKPTEFKDRFEPTEYCRAGFRHLADAARARKVPVYLWWSPSPTDAVSTEYLSEASRYADALGAEMPGFTVLRPAPAWEPNHFGTITHLAPAASRINSEQLAGALKKHSR